MTTPFAFKSLLWRRRLQRRSALRLRAQRPPVSVETPVLPALVFRQESRHRWTGRLVLPVLCIDRRTGKPATAVRYDITENRTTGVCTVLVQGTTPQGRRTVTYPNLAAAQAGGLRWVRRRFARHPDA